jgi:hypothetical protein
MFSFFRYCPRWIWQNVLTGRTEKYRKIINNYVGLVEKLVQGSVLRYSERLVGFRAQEASGRGRAAAA